MRTKKEKIKLTIKKNIELTKEYIYNLTLNDLIKYVKENIIDDNTFYQDDNIIIRYINHDNSTMWESFICIEPVMLDDYNDVRIIFEKDGKYSISYRTFNHTYNNFKGIKLDVYRVSDFVKHTHRHSMKISFMDKHFGGLNGNISTLRVYGYISAKHLRLSYMYDLKCLQEKLNDKLNELDYRKNINTLYETHPNISSTWVNIASDKDFKRFEKRIEKIKGEIKDKEKKIEECNERINKLKVKNYNYASEIH